MPKGSETRCAATITVLRCGRQVPVVIEGDVPGHVMADVFIRSARFGTAEIELDELERIDAVMALRTKAFELERDGAGSGVAA